MRAHLPPLVEGFEALVKHIGVDADTACIAHRFTSRREYRGGVQKSILLVRSAVALSCAYPTLENDMHYSLVL